jgi:hypothetical protein
MQYHFFKTCQSILDFFKRNAQINLRIFGLMQEKREFFLLFFTLFGNCFFDNKIAKTGLEGSLSNRIVNQKPFCKKIASEIGS